MNLQFLVLSKPFLCLILIKHTCYIYFFCEKHCLPMWRIIGGQNSIVLLSNTATASAAVTSFEMTKYKLGKSQVWEHFGKWLLK